MTNWRQKLSEPKTARRWYDIYSYALELLQTEDSIIDKIEVVIEAIFAFFDSLVYQSFESQEEYKKIAEVLHRLYAVSLAKYQHNAKFLFFLGYFMALSEWAFDQDDFQLSHQYLYEAWQIEPSGLL
jgi:hypothetical protein